MPSPTGEPEPESLPGYSYLLIREEDGSYFAKHPELPGCMSQGDTPAEAVAGLDEARNLWIETRHEDGLPVPEPAEPQRSGRTSLRIPVFVHAALARHAELLGWSLNRMLNRILEDFADRGDLFFASELLGAAATSSTIHEGAEVDESFSPDYPCLLFRDPEGGYFSRNPDLPGCMSQGETVEETLSSLGEARALWIETRLEDGLPVPRPAGQSEQTGYVSLRTSPQLHDRIGWLAGQNGVSLNQLIGSVLAGFAGMMAKAGSGASHPSTLLDRPADEAGLDVLEPEIRRVLDSV